MKPMVGSHSSPVFLLSLLFCVFFYLSNTSEITLITPRITISPPFYVSWLSSHILWNLFHHSNSEHSSWNHCSRWDTSTGTLPDTMCGISKPPAMSTKMICAHAAPALYHCDGVSTSLHRAPGVKVTWWMTGQSDRLSDAARHCRPWDGAGGRIVSQPGQKDIMIKKKRIWSVKLNNR